MADDNDTRDWAADCDGEGQDQVVRDGRDSGVVMIAATAEDRGGGQQQQRQTTTAADDSGMQDWVANHEGKDKSGRQERVETQGGNDGCNSGKWQRWMTMAADDDDGDGG